MYMEQFYTNCLAEAAYYIESDGEAAIIDPLRDINAYLELAKSRGAKIKYILETHFHADFVSGHIDLAQVTGAPICFGPSAETDYKIRNLVDEEILPLGKSSIKVLHTPGHTLESVCYLWQTPEQQPYAVFTGDTLLIDDVGRPDLVGGRYSKEEMAFRLYDSLKDKIKVLPPETLIYPGHGPGSACGKHIGKAKSSTLGEQMETNHLLQLIKRKKFIRQVVSDLPTPPAYFVYGARKNKKGYAPLGDILVQSKTVLSPDEFEEKMKEGVWVLDTRDAAEFSRGYIKDAINIGLSGQFAIWVGYLIPPETKILLVTDDDKLEESIVRLARVGYDNIIGHLGGGIKAWRAKNKPLEVMPEISAMEFKEKYKASLLNIIDVRRVSETSHGVLKGALPVCLSELPVELHCIAPNKLYYVHCTSGYRSMMACSLLRRCGFSQVVNITGGMQALQTTQLPLITVC